MTRELIAIDSVTGNEKALTLFLVDELRRRGMQVETFEVGNGRRNILARFEAASPKILFNTHVDTVPEQYGPHEDEERIYGRGACDTHGVLAAQLEAMHDLYAQGVAGLGILLVVGEETTHDGALSAARNPEIKPPEILIVGEPTENKLMTSQKGRLKAELVVTGKAGHSGYPEKFDSAVEKLIFFISRLLDAPWIANDSQAGTTVNVIILEGGSADNQVPGLARAKLMFRCAEGYEEVKRKVLATFAAANAELPVSSTPEEHCELLWDPAANDPVTSLATLAGFDTRAAAYNTDIAYFGWPNTRTFLLGPGSILQAHRDLNGDNWLDGEWILKQEQITGVEVYKRLVLKLFNQSDKNI